MGICFSKSKHVKAYSGVQSASCHTIKMSHIRVNNPQITNIFQKVTCPVQIQIMINSYQQLSNSQLKNEIQQCCFNKEWRKVECPEFSNKQTIGICCWNSQNQNKLHGKGFLYVHERSDYYLIGGQFNWGYIKKQTPYLKVFKSGICYIGQINNQFSANGQGQLYQNNILQYKGDFRNGVPHGKGQRFSIKGVYKGIFKNGQIVNGIHQNQDGVYQGQFKNNVKHGKGIQKKNSGTVYVGQFKNNKRDGFGSITDANGEVRYEGQWKNGKPASLPIQKNSF